MQPRIEFRIPISPTQDFFERVHLFCAGLKLVEPASAVVSVAVGDQADLPAVRRANSWSDNYRVQWHRVPDEIWARYSFYGTADFRYLLPDDGAELIVLSDADTVILRPISQDFSWMVRPEPCVAGHMAHVPAWFKPVAESGPASDDLWPFLFREFEIPWPTTLYPYSMNISGDVPNIPAYYNLGFVVLNRAALKIFRDHIFEIQNRLSSLIDSHMRCQIAVTLISYLYGMKRHNLPASYNSANDLRHLAFNGIPIEQIKVLHYLRTDEINKATFLTSERSTFLSSTLENPANRLLQGLVRDLFREITYSRR